MGASEGAEDACREVLDEGNVGGQLGDVAGGEAYDQQVGAPPHRPQRLLEPRPAHRVQHHVHPCGGGSARSGFGAGLQTQLVSQRQVCTDPRPPPRRCPPHAPHSAPWSKPPSCAPSRDRRQGGLIQGRLMQGGLHWVAASMRWDEPRMVDVP